MFVAAKNDEERFAALLILSKVIPAGDTAAIQTVYTTIGVGFILRLLQTKDGAGGGAGGEANLFQCIATSILSCFASVPEVAGDNDFLCVMQPLLEIIEEGPGDAADAQGEGAPDADAAQRCDQDALAIVAAAATTSEGRACLIRLGGDKVLVQVLGDTEEDEAVVTTALRTLMHLLHDGPGSGVRASSARVVAAVEATARCFALRNDGAKFDAAGCLAGVLDYIHGTYDPASATLVALQKSKAWSKLVGIGLKQVLGSRVGPEVRNTALRLAGLTIQLRGCGWALGTKINGAELLVLLVHLASVEMRMALEDRSLAECASQATLITSCYIIYEGAIETTVQEEDGDSAGGAGAGNAAGGEAASISTESFEKLHQRFSDGVNAVLQFLQVRQAATGDTVTDDVTALTLSSVRLVCVWMAEETDALRPELYAVLPFAIEAVSLDAEHDDLLRLMLPGLCHVTAEDEGRRVLVEAGAHATIIGHLLGSWIPHAIQQGRGSQAQGPQADAQSATTACSALLNVMVLAGRAVAMDAAVRKLCQDLFGHVVAKRLVFRAAGQDAVTAAATQMLFAHVVTLTLFIAQHHGSASSKAEALQFPTQQWEGFLGCAEDFFRAGIAAGGPQDSDGSGEGLLELWFLSLQCLAPCAQSHPALAQALKGSAAAKHWKDFAATPTGVPAASNGADAEGVPDVAEVIASTLRALSL